MKNIIIAILILAALGAAYFLYNKSQSQPALNVSGNEVIINYTDSGYSPSETTVKAGTTVKFVNESNNPMWTASDPHPVHTLMQEFDALRGMMMGQSYSFTFTKTGTWRYHNHMVPGHRGSVIVE